MLILLFQEGTTWTLEIRIEGVVVKDLCGMSLNTALDEVKHVALVTAKVG